MLSVALAQVIKPLVMLFLAFFVFAPAIYAIKRWMPEGRMKRALLSKIY